MLRLIKVLEIIQKRKFYLFVYSGPEFEGISQYMKNLGSPQLACMSNKITALRSALRLWYTRFIFFISFCHRQSSIPFHTAWQPFGMEGTPSYPQATALWNLYFSL